MLKDKLLIWKIKHGSAEALRSIYEKYKNELLALAIALSRDKAAAEDIVHDVFVSLAEFADKLQIRTSLKSYLAASVANRVRNLSRTKSRQTVPLDNVEIISSNSDRPDRLAISAEQSRLVGEAMAELPYQQREIIILHLQSDLKFREIADSQAISTNTAQSRYRYGLEKLRSILNTEVRK